MKNKIYLKKYTVISICSLILLIVVFSFINVFEYKSLTRNYNQKLLAIINNIKNNYDISDNDLINIINNDSKLDNNFLKQYGIDINTESIISKNDYLYTIYLIFNISYIVISLLILLIIFNKYNKKKENEIASIIKYLEEINKKNYHLSIDTISEDELSILRNEIYKITIMLKEDAYNSKIDKINLKNSLEDISHQLKTPLTSILIMLDDLIEDVNMDNNTKNDFILRIKREIMNINFLVQNILRLSKFDANTIKFVKKNNKLKSIIDRVLENVAALADLKGVSIIVNNLDDSIIIKCDMKWFIEAITNIVKNSIEHSNENGRVVIDIENNNIYTLIKITDFGNGIDKKDISHIFDRFYRASNSSKDSIGIGLALAKKIIDQDDGNISVETCKNGTSFIIKYDKL